MIKRILSDICFFPQDPLYDRMNPTIVYHVCVVYVSLEKAKDTTLDVLSRITLIQGRARSSIIIFQWFQYSLSVLKIYSAPYVYYKFLVLAVNIESPRHLHVVRSHAHAFIDS